MAHLHIAVPHGFCFGISRAIEIAQDSAEKYKNNLYFYGELVHNQYVVDWLETQLGIKTIKDINEIPRGSTVIIRAHGAAPSVFRQAVINGLTVIDASCPLVLKSHQTAIDLCARFQKVIFLCNSITHDETIGIVGENPEKIFPITLNEVDKLTLTDAKQCAVMTQTTLSTIETNDAFNLLKDKYPDLTIIPNICQATNDRQKAVIELAKTCTLFVIVGSPTSANCISLAQVAAASGAKTIFVNDASELDPKLFSGHEEIGLSSGASTPESIFDEVKEKIKEITGP